MNNYIGLSLRWPNQDKGVRLITVLDGEFELNRDLIINDEIVEFELESGPSMYVIAVNARSIRLLKDIEDRMKNANTPPAWLGSALLSFLWWLTEVCESHGDQVLMHFLITSIMAAVCDAFLIPLPESADFMVLLHDTWNISAPTMTRMDNPGTMFAIALFHAKMRKFLLSPEQLKFVAGRFISELIANTKTAAEYRYYYGFSGIWEFISAIIMTCYTRPSQLINLDCWDLLQVAVLKEVIVYNSDIGDAGVPAINSVYKYLKLAPDMWEDVHCLDAREKMTHADVDELISVVGDDTGIIHIAHGAELCGWHELSDYLIKNFHINIKNLPGIKLHRRLHHWMRRNRH